jgi:hypothetical protein
VAPRSWAAAGVLSLVLLAPVTAGCGVVRAASTLAKSKASPAASAAPTPKQEVTDALKVLETSPYHFTANTDDGSKVSGDIDPTAHALQVVFALKEDGVPMTMTFRVVDSECYAKIDVKGVTVPGLEDPRGRWMHTDPDRLGGLHQALVDMTSGDGDPFGGKGILWYGSAVTKVDDTHFTGTTDLSRLDSIALSDDALVKALGAKASAVPFEVVLDDRHRPVSVTLTVPPAGKATSPTVLKATYGGFGESADLARPAADQTVEASKELYQMFQG